MKDAILSLCANLFHTKIDCSGNDAGGDGNEGGGWSERSGDGTFLEAGIVNELANFIKEVYNSEYWILEIFN